jgi:hypothetical protein
LVGEPALHLSIIRGCACAALKNVAAAQQEFESALATPLASVDYLSAPGIASLLMRALNACQNQLADKNLTTQFEDRLLASYLAPEEFFQASRMERPESKVTFYQVLVRQPLDENWMSFAGRLPDEEDSDSYLGSWGVLAEDEDAAQRLVLQWQSRCYPLESEIVEVSGNDESFSDCAGIVWQGQRILPGHEDNSDFDNNDFDGNDFDDDDYHDDDQLNE